MQADLYFCCLQKYKVDFLVTRLEYLFLSRRNFSALECVASQQSANQNEVDVEVNFGNLRKVIPEKFTYVKDPEITMIEPKKTILR